MIFQIIKNNIPEKDFKLYMMELYCFLFTDNSTGDEIGDSVIFLKIILDDIKLSTVPDMQDLEEILALATFRKCKNNVLPCTREMENLYKDIRRLKPGTYDNNRFLTQFFCALETMPNESFERKMDFG